MRSDTASRGVLAPGPPWVSSGREGKCRDAYNIFSFSGMGGSPSRLRVFFPIASLAAHFAAAARALAVALMIASEVIVAPLVASTPLTPCLAMSFFGVSVKAE